VTGLLCDRTNPKALLQCDGRPKQALTVSSRFNLEAMLAFNLFFMQHGCAPQKHLHVQATILSSQYS
jgi:hypothetical protein